MGRSTRLGGAVRVATFLPLIDRGKVANLLAPDCRLHSPSWAACNAASLSSEVRIIRLPVDPDCWPDGGPTWGRERFCNRLSPGLVAYSIDKRGHTVRGWFNTPRDMAAYAAGGFGQFGPITAPIEAAWLQHLQVGRPSIPAHLVIGAEKGWPGFEDALAKLATSP